jgi:hypothetical protein
VASEASAEAPATDESPALPAPSTPAGETPSREIDPPLPTVRPLDDELRSQIRQELLRERAVELMEKKVQEASNFMSEMGMLVNTPPDDPDHIKPEEAAERLKKYAAENGLVYVETPWLSYEELEQSEDFPIGQAQVLTAQRGIPVVQDVMQNFQRSMKYQPRRAVNPFSNSPGHFAYWITDERRDFVPEDLSDELVRDQAVKAWRESKAREKARERAEAVAAMVRASKDPMGQAIADETVTGKPGTSYLSVRPTGKFSWYRMPVVPPRDMQASMPRLTEIAGLKPLGQQFMEKVFSDLKPGDVGVAESADKSEIYVVKIGSRTPSTPEELESFRQRFLARGITPEYRTLSQLEMQRYGRNGLDELWKKHDVQIVSNRSEETP